VQQHQQSAKLGPAVQGAVRRLRHEIRVDSASSHTSSRRARGVRDLTPMDFYRLLFGATALLVSRRNHWSS
jgi:hypothetical protein